MNWPWNRKPENRGTLTLLPDGQIVLGLPYGETHEEMAHMKLYLAEWTSKRDRPTLVLPFPVDVDDRR